MVSPRIPSAETASAAGEELAQGALSGAPAEAMAPFAGGEMARVAVPVRDREGAVRGAVVVSTFVPLAVAAEVREVEERYTLYRKAESAKDPIKAVYLSLYLFIALRHPVRRGVAVAVPRAPHHHAVAAGGRRRGADRVRRARRARGLPVRGRRVHRPHRVLQPHVGAAGPERGGGRAHPRRPHAEEPRARGPGPPDADGVRDRRHRRSWWPTPRGRSRA